MIDIKIHMMLVFLIMFVSVSIAVRLLIIKIFSFREQAFKAESERDTLTSYKNRVDELIYTMDIVDFIDVIESYCGSDFVFFEYNSISSMLCKYGIAKNKHIYVLEENSIYYEKENNDNLLFSYLIDVARFRNLLSSGKPTVLITDLSFSSYGKKEYLKSLLGEEVKIYFLEDILRKNRIYTKWITTLKNI